MVVVVIVVMLPLWRLAALANFFELPTALLRLLAVLAVLADGLLQVLFGLADVTHHRRVSNLWGCMLNVGIENSGNLTVLRFSGRLVFGEEVSPLFNGVISQKNKRAVVLDLARVSRIDACGLGILVFLKQWARGAGVKLQLIPSKTVQELLDLTGLHSLFEIRSSESVQPVSNFSIDSREDGAVGIAADD